MSATIQTNEVFRLVSLRSSRAQATQDPTSDEPVVLRTSRGVEVPNLDWSNPSPEAETFIARQRTFDSHGIAREIPWSGLSDEFIEAPDKDYGNRSIELNEESISLRQYAMSTEFREAYRDLYNSWLALKLKERLGQYVDPDILHQHAANIRFAVIIGRIGRSDYNPFDGRFIKDTPLLLPHSWRKRPRSSSGAGSETAKRKPSGDRRTPVEKLQEKRQQLEREIDHLNAGMAAAAHVFGALGMDPRDPAPLGDSFYDALEGSLSEAERKTVMSLLSGGARPSTINGLQDRFEGASVVKGDEANSLCHQIQVFENETREKLPEAQPLQSKTRPSVRALGWGDLIVVKEALVGYSANEIAHIENVLAGEKKKREHERTQTIEEVVEFEEVEETFSERDLETSDRFELQTESEKAIETEFSIEAGVNTSGRYGLTKVDTSLDVAFSRSEQEAERTAITTAQEVVSRSVERTNKSVRQFRRTTTIESIRELSKHAFDNTVSGTGPEPEHISGIYLWVEKIHKLQLRQYGKRLMVEFFIPEPGVSLIEEREPIRPDVPKPTPLRIGPNDITPGNYLCLTALFKAVDVQPPPPMLRQSGISFRTEVRNASDAKDAESTMAVQLKIPDGYIPISGTASVTGRGRTNHNNLDVFQAHVAVGGQAIIDSAVQLDGGPNEVGLPSYSTSFALSEPVLSDDHGLPITGRLSGHDDETGTINVRVTSRRSSELYTQWRIDTYEKIKQAHAVLVEEYQQSAEQARFLQETDFSVGNRPSQQNRSIERDELRKWAVKTMRVTPYGFDAIVDEQGIQEIDPVASDAQAPITRFFEDAFEWAQMSYILHPYFWGRRTAWSLRQNLNVPDDPKHEAFLRAGSARVIVPVVPGYEDRVLHYLEADPFAEEWNPENPDARIPPEPLDLDLDDPAAVEDREFGELWLELLEDRRDDVLRGRGTLNVTNGNAHVDVNPGGWILSSRDLHREIYVDGVLYEIIAIDASGEGFQLDRPYEGVTDGDAVFATASVALGAPWQVKIPTRLLVLKEQISKLNASGT